MEVDHQLQAQSLCTQRLCHHVGLVAIAIGGVHPHAQTYCVHAQLLHQLEAVGLLAVSVIKFHSRFLHLRHPTDVGTFGKGHGLCRLLVVTVISL